MLAQLCFSKFWSQLVNIVEANVWFIEITERSVNVGKSVMDVRYVGDNVDGTVQNDSRLFGTMSSM